MLIKNLKGFCIKSKNKKKFKEEIKENSEVGDESINTII